MQRRNTFKIWDTVYDRVLFGWRICSGGFSGRESCLLSEKDGSRTGLGEKNQINGNDRLWGKWLVCNAGGAVSGLSHLPIEGFYTWEEICVNLLLEKTKKNKQKYCVEELRRVRLEQFKGGSFYAWGALHRQPNTDSPLWFSCRLGGQWWLSLRVTSLDRCDYSDFDPDMWKEASPVRARMGCSEWKSLVLCGLVFVLTVVQSSDGKTFFSLEILHIFQKSNIFLL